MTIDKQIRIAGGSVVILHFIGSAYGTQLSFDDNETSYKLASYYGSVDNVVYDHMTPEFMQYWHKSGKDLYVKVDATRFGFGETLILSNFSIDVPVSTEDTVAAFTTLQLKIEGVRQTIEAFANEASSVADTVTLDICNAALSQLDIIDSSTMQYYYANTLSDKLPELMDLLAKVADDCAIDLESIDAPVSTALGTPPALDVEVVNANFAQGYYVGSTAFDVQNLKDAVTEYAFDVSRGAEDNAAWPIKYYRSTLVRNIDILNNYELKSIQDSAMIKTVPAFYPKTKLLGKLDFDQFGIKYDDITDLHILAETFHRLYDDKFARPAKCDIIYIDFLDQFFEVTDCDDVKTATNQVLYYDIKLALITDRHNVAKDSDLLDLSELTDATDQADIEQLHIADKDKPVIVTYPAKTWKLQKFENAQVLALSDTDNYCYGICYYADNWCKFYQHGSIAELTSLAEPASPTETIDIAQLGTMPFAKFAMFDAKLNDTDRNMYYTSYTLIRTLQPLQLIELQRLAN